METVGKPDTNRAKLAVMMKRMMAKHPHKQPLTITTIVINGTVMYQIVKRKD